MTDDRFLELASLAALGALDGDDRAGFDAHVSGCAACRGELHTHEAVASRIGLALAPVDPSPALARRVLDATRPAAARSAPRAVTTTAGGPTRAAWLAPLAAAAALVMGIAFLLARGERDAARREADAARQSTAALDAQARRTQEELLTLRRSLAEAQAFRELVAHPDARVASLAGLKDAPAARGRVVWNPASREAVLIATGLPPAPEGKGYEVWVIAQGAPVPAGVFQVDAQGRAVFKLPTVDETARVKTFAVTLEPATGVPAPTGPMVLAGAVS